MTRKVCVVTGSRAEYGLLRWVMDEVRRAEDMTLQVVSTGMHLSPQFGLTRREIEAHGFSIDRQVETLMDSDTLSGVTKSLGLGVIGFADALKDLSPDIVVLLGDRYEILAAAVAALIARVPVAHLHGGELTEGAFDDAIRHSITKMSHLHFVSLEEYRRRVIQLGENPKNVHLVGAMGIDSIRKLELMDRETLEKELDFELGKRNLLITFHPVTLGKNSGEEQMKELLRALEDLNDTHFIFTMPNADPGSRVLFELIKSFVDRHPRARAYTSLGQRRYLSCMQQVDGMVGNSSSGLVEMPAFKKGTVNVGERQKGRLKGGSVIDCAPTRADIAVALEKLYSEEFQHALKGVANPYGDGRASERVVEVIGAAPLDNLTTKRFFDLDVPGYNDNVVT